MAATAPRAASDDTRLLVIDPHLGRFADRRVGDLCELLRANDALVLNDAATLPASLRAAPDLELRLMSQQADGAWLALAFGRGDERMSTEARGLPEPIPVGGTLDFGHGLSARVEARERDEPRLLRLRFEPIGAAFWRALYLAGRPIQYAYLRQPLALWDVQNGYAARPWAVELPSAGKPLRFETLFRLRERGVQLATVTHAAGLSSTGEARLDARLPIAERYELTEQNAALLRATRARAGRVIAVGTSVTRALEAASESGELRAGSRSTSLVLSRDSRRRTCDALLTGLHEPGTSHFSLLECYAPRALLERAMRHAARAGYLEHEFGDSCLILSGALGEERNSALRRAS